MEQSAGLGEPIHLEVADAIELYAAIIGGTSFAAGTSPPELAPRIRETLRPA